VTGLADTSNKPVYQVVLVFETGPGYWDPVYDEFMFDIHADIHSGVGHARLWSEYMPINLVITGVYEKQNRSWYGESAYNLWTGGDDLYDPYTHELTLNGLPLSLDGVFSVVIVYTVEPLEGKGVYTPLLEFMMMSSGPMSAQESDPSTVLIVLAMTGKLAPAVTPDWWYHQGQTTALDSMLDQLTSKASTLFDYFINMTKQMQPEFARAFASGPTLMDLSASATWTTTPPTREMVMHFLGNSVMKSRAQAGYPPTSDYPFTYPTNITIEASMGTAEHWTSAGIMQDFGVSASVDLAVVKLSTTTTTTVATNTTTTESKIVFGTPGFELATLVVSSLAVAVAIVIRRRQD
jgi:hypothetical protein